MHFIETPHKLPYELGAEHMQIAVGCSYNKCRFCYLHRNKDYRVSPMSEIEEDLDELASHHKHPTRIFFYSGNPFGMPQDQLVSILELAHEKLPELQTFGGYARVADIASKTDEELVQLRELGVTDMNIGAESGWDETLKALQKPQTAAKLEGQCARLRKAGIGFTLFYLAGAAGKGKCAENARRSAEVFNRINPDRINIMTLTIFDKAPLYDDVQEGRFTPATEKEIMHEIADFIEGLTDATSYIQAGHDTNILHFEGTLPRDREGMVRWMRERIDRMSDRHLEAYRKRFVSM